MAPDRIKKIINAVPFRPFTVELGSGKRVPVKHADYVSLSPAGRTLIVYDDDDGMEILDVFLITSIDVKPTSTRKTSR
jgi:hypothetical protein